MKSARLSCIVFILIACNQTPAFQNANEPRQVVVASDNLILRDTNVVIEEDNQQVFSFLVKQGYTKKVVTWYPKLGATITIKTQAANTTATDSWQQFQFNANGVLAEVGKRYVVTLNTPALPMLMKYFYCLNPLDQEC